MGSMEFAVPILEILNKNYAVDLVVTQPDKPFGRKQLLKPTPVKEKAIELDIPVFQPVDIKTDNEAILKREFDFIIVAAYGQIIPEKILIHGKYRAINVHASLLPKYRGGSPMHTAIKNGDKKTGVTIMYMEKKMDAGEILAQQECEISFRENVETLEMKLSELGSRLLIETLNDLQLGLISPVVQDESKVTYAWNIKREDERLDFNKTAEEVYNHVRAFYPWPLTYTEINGKKLKIFQVDFVAENISKNIGEIVKADNDGVYIQTADGMVIIKELQLAGKTRMTIDSFMNGVGKNLFIVGNMLD